MSRVQKKCLIASLFTHGVMLLAVIVGSAFVSPEPEVIQPTIELVDIPDMLIDENFVGGGSPAAAAAPVRPPAVAPPPVQPVEQRPPPVREPEPAPVPEPVAAKEDPKPIIEPKPEKPKPRPKPVKKPPVKAPAPKPKIAVNLNAVERTTTAEPAPEQNNRVDTTAKLNELKNRLSANISEKASGETAVSIPGPGGAAYAPYSAYLKKVYQDAWIPPGNAQGNPVVKVEIVIARDGRVVSARITRKSGDGALDRSVQTTLDRFRKLRPLPETSSDPKRTFNINFNLASKRNYG